MRFYRFTGPTRENGIPVKLPTLWRETNVSRHFSASVVTPLEVRVVLLVEQDPRPLP
jgi:hypothetical protein